MSRNANLATILSPFPLRDPDILISIMKSGGDIPTILFLLKRRGNIAKRK